MAYSFSTLAKEIWSRASSPNKPRPSHNRASAPTVATPASQRQSTPAGTRGHPQRPTPPPLQATLTAYARYQLLAERLGRTSIRNAVETYALISCDDPKLFELSAPSPSTPSNNSAANSTSSDSSAVHSNSTAPSTATDWNSDIRSPHAT